MNIFAVTSLACGVACTILALVAFIFGKARIHRILTLFNISVAIWGYGCFLVGMSNTEVRSLFGWRFAQVGGIFIAVFFYHMISIFCELPRRAFIIIIYLWGLFFAYFCFFTNLLFAKTRFIYNVFYNSATILYTYLVFSWLLIVCLSFFEILRYLSKAKGTKRRQALYVIFGFLTGFVGGSSTLIPMFGVKFYPYGNITIPVYCLIATYAILKYRLLDINVAITRTGIFVVVYSLVLGLPFIVAYSLQSYLISLFGSKWWIVPLILSTFLATTGPFIYLFIQRRAEDRLLREQRRYQSTLRQASTGMARIRNLDKLLNLIVHIVTRTVRLKHGSVYLLDKKNNQYILRAIRDKGRTKAGSYLDSNSALIWNLILQKEPIVYEEVKQRSQDYYDEKLIALEKEMKNLDAAVVVPSFIEEKLLGFIVLGEKLSGKIYSQDDLTVFSVLANQAALAIENAQFYEDIKQTQMQLFQAEKMATIGTMADGLSHQINNRFHALGMISADAMDALKSINENSTSEDIKQVFAQLNHALERVKENVKQGGEVVHGLLKYSRAGEAGFEAVDLDTLVNASLDMAQYKVKLSQIDLFRDYTKDIPKIKGNFTQLQEVFFNLIDNAYDAITQRKSELNEPEYRGNVTIQAVAKDSKIEIRFIDNGMGVRESEKERLFTPFFTTKTSTKKGTGLGLYVIQKIIVDNHKGKISWDSEYKTGTMFTIELPTAASV